MGRPKCGSTFPKHELLNARLRTRKGSPKPEPKDDEAGVEVDKNEGRRLGGVARQALHFTRLIGLRVYAAGRRFASQPGIPKS